MSDTRVISRLYKACNQVREVLSRSFADAEQMREIAMNAAVAATHTGSLMRIFAEVARQIETTAQRIAAAAKESRSLIDVAVSINLQAMQNQAHLSKYREALAGVAGEDNRQLLQECIDAFDRKIQTSIRSLSTTMSDTTAVIHTLIQHQHRVFSLISAIKVESIGLQGSALSTIESLVAALTAINEDADDRLDTAEKLITTMLADIRLNATAPHEAKETHELHQAV